MMNTFRTLSGPGLASLAGFGALLAAAPLPALAQGGGHPYVGVAVGQSQARIDDARITAGLLAAGQATTSMQLDERSAAYKLFGGYQFNPYVALEAGYFDLGRFGYTAQTNPPGALQGQIKLRGLNLDLVGSLPLSPRWSVIARVGAHHTQARDNFSGSGAVNVLTPSLRETATNLKFGGGVQYAVTPSVLVRAEAERYRINDAMGNRGDVNLVSLSLVVPFGRAPAATRVAAPAPMPAPQPVVQVAAAPPAAPVAVPAPPPPPPPPERRRVNFSADSLFGFDQATITPEGRQALDRFIAELDGTQFDTILVDGHTDRLGAAGYNQALSLRRADAVKAYLVSAGRIDPQKLRATGQGESAPVTQAADCKGSRASAALIACLQPDRRVDVEVAGSKR